MMVGEGNISYKDTEAVDGSAQPVDRVARARELFLKGYNCSQSVFCAFADMYGISDEMALKVSASFGGGIGRMRGTCGTVCGMAMLAGMEKGQTLPDDRWQKQENYKLVQELAGKFKEMNGSIICSELLGLRKDAKIVSMPDERTAEYYKTRPCLRMVESAASIWQDYLNTLGRKF
ncbi:MAG: C-GCAxxG-C-C family protein [Bacteroides sp.]|nr:C-GCAxxG-C-C family protein [Roseburia sp.]MCM1347053.1 C-GCAxxG-C-C family protein [Bacteroides sp.]MCM1421735.1 C-GCAxxG-C-C family protein [Bacteroides sp.]